MSTWALVIEGTVREVTDRDPAEHYPREMPWEPCPENVVAGWTSDLKGFSAPVAPPPLPKPTVMSPLAFLGRLTTAEYAAVCSAALSNAGLLAWVLQATAAQSVDLADPRTKAGLDALVAAGLLTAEREAAILIP